MGAYLQRLLYALIHINVPIPSPEGYFHWYVFHLGSYTLTVFITGLIIGYMIKKYPT